MASLAYELQPNRARAAAPQVQVVRGGRRKLDQIKQVLQVVRTALIAAVMLGLVVSLVYSQSVITELTGEVEKARNDLTASQSTYDYLAASMDAITSRANVQEIAEGSLGLVPADSSQYTYIKLEDESVITKANTSAERFLTGFRTAALSLIGSLDP